MSYRPGLLQLIGLFLLIGTKTPAQLPPAPAHNMLWVAGGTFLMGDQWGDEPANNAERPVHTVTLSGFYLDQTETTFEAYDAFCMATGRDTLPSSGWGRGRQPVFNVSWFDAVLYCNWRSVQERFTPVYTVDSSSIPWQVKADWAANGYRLPTEAEWEFAARALNRQGGAKVRFATGRDSISPAEANYNPNDPAPKPWALPGTYRKRTLHADSLGVNSLGFRHLSGNVWEWCWDWFDKSWYAQSEGATDPRGPDYGNFRICRGGSFGMPAAFCRAACRAWGAPADRTSYVGFRVARSGP
ncbi:MAG TPA: SUMF1/EgtB/PvdO family nonheme iron enzyme [Saprospiraceae bacterium]|nr:SUMF1/EgtB/PvdO family nonheme iron enzyme [Saprospiraceae bacterium]